MSLELVEPISPGLMSGTHPLPLDKCLGMHLYHSYAQYSQASMLYEYVSVKLARFETTAHPSFVIQIRTHGT